MSLRAFALRHSLWWSANVVNVSFAIFLWWQFDSYQLDSRAWWRSGERTRLRANSPYAYDTTFLQTELFIWLASTSPWGWKIWKASDWRERVLRKSNNSSIVKYVVRHTYVSPAPGPLGEGSQLSIYRVKESMSQWGNDLVQLPKPIKWKLKFQNA